MPDIGKPVKLRITTISVRTKLTDESNTLIHDFPMFKISYCGTDNKHKEAVTIVAKDSGQPLILYMSVMWRGWEEHSGVGQR